jgi:hypothetical protein
MRDVDGVALDQLDAHWGHPLVQKTGVVEAPEIRPLWSAAHRPPDSGSVWGFVPVQ